MTPGPFRAAATNGAGQDADGASRQWDEQACRLNLALAMTHSGAGRHDRARAVLALELDGLEDGPWRRMLLEAARLVELRREAEALFASLQARIAAPHGRPHGSLPPFSLPPLNLPPLNLPPLNLPPLQVRCMGRFEVWREAHPVTLCGSRRGQSVFKYLLGCSERMAPRDHLIELFWPGATAPSGQHSLRVALHALRTSLDGAPRARASYIVCSNGMYAINPAASVEVDVDRFTALHRLGAQHERAGRPEEAVTAYEQAIELFGEFLPEDTYEDWALARREHLETLYLGALGRLAQLHDWSGRYRRSLEACRLILERDGAREDAHRQAMRCLARLGQREVALRQYRLCEQALQEDFAVRPTRETQDLADRIARGEPVG